MKSGAESSLRSGGPTGPAGNAPSNKPSERSHGRPLSLRRKPKKPAAGLLHFRAAVWGSKMPKEDCRCFQAPTITVEPYPFGFGGPPIPDPKNVEPGDIRKPKPPSIPAQLLRPRFAMPKDEARRMSTRWRELPRPPAMPREVHGVRKHERALAKLQRPGYSGPTVLFLVALASLVSAAMGATIVVAYVMTMYVQSVSI